MVLVGHAKSRQAPSVFYVRVQGNRVGFHRKRCAVREDLNCAREIVSDCAFEFLAPARSIGRKTLTIGEIDWGHVKTSVYAAAPTETNFLWIKFVKVVDDAADGETFVIIELFFEHAERDCS